MMGKANPTDASKCLFRPRLLIIQIGKGAGFKVFEDTTSMAPDDTK